MYFKTQSPGIPISQEDEKEFFKYESLLHLIESMLVLSKDGENIVTRTPLWMPLTLSPITAGEVFGFLFLVMSSSAASKGRSDPSDGQCLAYGGNNPVFWALIRSVEENADSLCFLCG